MNQTFEYIIITVANHDQSRLDEFDVYCSSWIQHARHNSDNTKCIMKLDITKPTPDCVISMTRYNRAEIKKILLADEWTLIPE